MPGRDLLTSVTEELFEDARGGLKVSPAESPGTDICCNDPGRSMPLLDLPVHRGHQRLPDLFRCLASGVIGQVRVSCGNPRVALAEELGKVEKRLGSGVLWI